MKKIKTRGESSVDTIFTTIPGISFEIEYEELKQYFMSELVYAISLRNYRSFNKIFDSKENIRKAIEMYFFPADQYKRIKNPLKRKKLKKLENDVNQILEDIEIDLTNLKEKIEPIFIKYGEIIGIHQNESNENLDNSNSEVDDTDFYHERLKGLQRKISNFIFSFYAIIEKYTNDLLIDIFELLPSSAAFDVLSNNSYNDISDPIKKIKLIKSTLKELNSQTISHFEKIINDNQLAPNVAVLNQLKKLRDLIGHRKPFVELDEIFEEPDFNYFKRKSKKKMKKELKELSETPFVSFEKLFKNLIKEIEIGFFVGEVGDAIFNYLSLFDFMITLFTNPFQCIHHLKMEETDYLVKIIIEAVKECLETDRHLLSIDTWETSIVHRVATYLGFGITQLSDNYFVDIEYDHTENEKKSIITQFAEWDTLTNNSDIEKDNKTGQIRPDLIVHERGIQNSNLLVVEVKNNNSKTKKSRSARAWDLFKIRCMMTSDILNYKFGCFINFKKTYDLAKEGYNEQFKGDLLFFIKSNNKILEINSKLTIEDFIEMEKN